MIGKTCQIIILAKAILSGVFLALYLILNIPSVQAAASSAGMSVGLSILPVINYSIYDNKLNLSSNDLGQSVVIYDGNVIYSGNNGPGVQTIKLPKNKPNSSHEVTILSGI